MLYNVLYNKGDDMNLNVDYICRVFKQKNLILRLVIFFVAVFVLALNYNIFITPNNFNIGGTSGLAVIVNSLFNIKPSLFILISSIILLIISYFTLDKNQTYRSIIGAFLYPLFISLTEPLANLIIPYVDFSNILITIIIGGSLFGICTGFIYKTGFTTGGGDIVIKIISKYNHISEGNAQLIANGTIIVLGTFVFGLVNLIYSLIVIIISALLVDKILLGISDSKMFLIYTKKVDELQDIILKNMATGVTIFNTEGGYKGEKRKMLMVVVPNGLYYLVKETILNIDSEAFFIISDCYEVKGGVKKKSYSFI